MRLILSLTLILPGAAVAHPGHLIELGGHSHWVAGAAIGLAVAVGIWGKLRDSKSRSEGEQEEAEAEDEEAPA